ncbi:hypothetical protein H8E88_35805 [candidate division KSB1 bacterium]|nr:hypothetical protein [candidate division KSB1 bacterium]
MQQKEWQKEIVEAIKNEAKRVLERIEEYEKVKNFSTWNNHQIAAIKRSTLDFNKEAVKLRAGFYHKK